MVERDAGTELAQAAQILCAFLVHALRIEILDAHMREGVAADLMTGGVKRADLILADHAPMRVLVAAGAARDIESAAQARAVPAPRRR